MDIYYAFTDLQIINMVNLKLNYYYNEHAELIILHHQRINMDIVNIIVKNNIFDDVKIFDRDTTDLPTNTPLKLITTIIVGKKTLKHFKSICHPELIDDCSRIFIAGFWRYAEYITNMFLEYNPMMRISLVDEGLATYWFTMDDFTYKYILEKNIHDTFKRIITYSLLPIFFAGVLRPHLVTKLKKRIDELYLYSPEMRNQIISDKNKHYFLKPLPIANRENPIFNTLLNPGSREINYIEYQKRDFIYLAQGNHPYESDYATLTQMLKVLSDNIAGDKIIIKQHPEYKIPIELFQKLNYRFSREAYLDNNIFSIEMIYNNIDLNNKVLITNISSSVFNAKLMFGYEPYIIFIPHLYPIQITTTNQKMMEQLKLQYSEKSRIYIPTTFAELNDILADLNDKLTT